MVLVIRNGIEINRWTVSFGTSPIQDLKGILCDMMFRYTGWTFNISNGTIEEDQCYISFLQIVLAKQKLCRIFNNKMQLTDGVLEFLTSRFMQIGNSQEIFPIWSGQESKEYQFFRIVVGLRIASNTTTERGKIRWNETQYIRSSPSWSSKNRVPNPRTLFLRIRLYSF